MPVIIRLQRLPLSASSSDIRQFFATLSIPDGGVHIVGGPDGDAFIAFADDENARQAMRLDGNRLHDTRIKLMLSSRVEMDAIIAKARTGELKRSKPAVDEYAHKRSSSPSPPPAKKPTPAVVSGYSSFPSAARPLQQTQQVQPSPPTAQPFVSNTYNPSRPQLEHFLRGNRQSSISGVREMAPPIGHGIPPSQSTGREATQSARGHSTGLETAQLTGRDNSSPWTSSTRLIGSGRPVSVSNQNRQVTSSSNHTHQQFSSTATRRAPLMPDPMAESTVIDERSGTGDSGREDRSYHRHQPQEKRRSFVPENDSWVRSGSRGDADRRDNDRRDQGRKGIIARGRDGRGRDNTNWQTSREEGRGNRSWDAGRGDDTGRAQGSRGISQRNDRNRIDHQAFAKGPSPPQRDSYRANNFKPPTKSDGNAGDNYFDAVKETANPYNERVGSVSALADTSTVDDSPLRGLFGRSSYSSRGPPPAGKGSFVPSQGHIRPHVQPVSSPFLNVNVPGQHNMHQSSVMPADATMGATRNADDHRANSSFPAPSNQHLLNQAAFAQPTLPAVTTVATGADSSFNTAATASRRGRPTLLPAPPVEAKVVEPPPTEPVAAAVQPVNLIDLMQNVQRQQQQRQQQDHQQQQQDHQRQQQDHQRQQQDHQQVTTVSSGASACSPCVELSRLPVELLRPAALEQWLRPIAPLTLSSVKVVYDPQGFPLRTLVKFENLMDTGKTLLRNGEQGIRILPCSQADFDSAVDGIQMPSILPPVAMSTAAAPPISLVPPLDLPPPPPSMANFPSLLSSIAASLQMQQQQPVPTMSTLIGSSPSAAPAQVHAQPPLVVPNSGLISSAPGRFCLEFWNVSLRATVVDIQGFLGVSLVPNRIGRSCDSRDRWIVEFGTMAEAERAASLQGRIFGQPVGVGRLSIKDADRLFIPIHGHQQPPGHTGSRDWEKADQQRRGFVDDRRGGPVNDSWNSGRRSPNKDYYQHDDRREPNCRAVGSSVERRAKAPSPSTNTSDGRNAIKPAEHSDPKSDLNQSLHQTEVIQAVPVKVEADAGQVVAPSVAEPQPQSLEETIDIDPQILKEIGSTGSVLAVHGLPASVTIDDLQLFFKPYTVVEDSVRLHFDDDGRATGDCILALTNAADSLKFVTDMSKHGGEMHGLPVTVFIARSGKK